MKTKIIHFNILLLIFSLSFWHSISQCQTNYYTFHYPLSIGDYWEYEESNILYRVYRKVIGDTLMPNEKKYKIIQKSSDLSPYYFTYKFQRIKDSTEVYQYVAADSTPQEEKIFDLHVAVGDTWKYPTNSFGCLLGVNMDSAFLKVDRIQIKDVLGRELDVMKIHSYSLPDTAGPFERSFFVSDSLGIINEGFEMAYYTLKGAIIDGKKYGDITSVNKDGKTDYLPDNIQLSIYPNPFNSGTVIYYAIHKTQHVEISIYDIIGRKEVTLVNKKMRKGYHKIPWLGTGKEGQSLPSGLYLCRILGEYFSDTRKLCILR